MSTTAIDASGVTPRGVEVDRTLVAVRVLDPRAAWTRMKVRALRTLRTVRARAAARQAAIAQFVKPYWEKIPSGLPGLALLASMAHTPVYCWVMRRAEQVTSFTGRTIKTGLVWTGRALRWAGRTAARALGWLWPAAGDRMSTFVEDTSVRTTYAFDKACISVANGHRDFYAAATSDAATTTMRKLATPLAVGVGINLVSQGLLAALVSSIPVVGLPLASVLTTGRGMGIAAGAIAALSLFDGYTAVRKAKATPPLAAAGVPAEGPVAPAPAGATTATPETEETAPIAAATIEAVEGEHKAEVTTREVIVDGEVVTIEVTGPVSDEEAQALAIEHIHRQHAEEEAQLRTLEAEMKPGAKKAAAKQHGPQPKGRGKQSQPRPAGRR